MLPKNQFGFRKNKSCLDNLTILTNDIQKSFFKNESLIALFLDIKGAFDNVIPDLLLADLAELKLPKTYLYFFKNLLQQRVLTPLGLQELEQRYLAEIGLPQGSVSGPPLWAIYIRFLEKIFKNRVKLLKFADDLVIYIEGLNIPESLAVLESEANMLYQELKKKNLILSPEKSTLMIFNKSNIKINKYKLKLNGVEICPSSCVKFLGMFFDRKLNWKKHIDQVKIKCKQPLNIIKCLRGVHWGSDPKVLLMLYKSLIRSKLEYGGFLLFPSKEAHLNELEKVQNSAVRLSLGYQCTTPINVMLEKIPYLKFRFEFLCYKYLLKNLSVTENLTLESIEALLEISENPIYESNFEKSLILNCFEKCWFRNGIIFQSDSFFKFKNPYLDMFASFDCSQAEGFEILQSNDPKAKFVELFSNPETIDIFTDGSKIESSNKSCVGFSAFSHSQFFTQAFKVPDESSIFTAESLAIKFTLKKIIDNYKTNEYHNKEIRIFTDSKSVIDSLCKPKGLTYESPIIVQLRCLLCKIKNLQIKVKLYWIPAHVGIHGNEKADESAKEAATKGILANIAIPFSDLIPIYKKMCEVKNRAKAKEISSQKGAFYYVNFFSLSKVPWFIKYNVPRRVITTINRIRSGHTSLNSDLFRYKIVDSDLCKCGKVPDTVEHIFFVCELYNEQRILMLKRLQAAGLYGPYSILKLLSEIDLKKLDIISKFIMNIEFKF